jgi:hypothetical protein
MQPNKIKVGLRQVIPTGIQLYPENPGHIARNCQGRTERYSDRDNNRSGKESRTNYLRDSKEIEKTNAGPAYGPPYGDFALN